MAYIEMRGKMCYVRFGKTGCIPCREDRELAETILAKMQKKIAAEKALKLKKRLKKLYKEGGI